jgi:hypothetical protein
MKPQLDEIEKAAFPAVLSVVPSPADSQNQRNGKRKEEP